MNIKYDTTLHKSSVVLITFILKYGYAGSTKLARQCTINSATGSSSPSLLIESVMISSFSTNGRNNWTNSALYGGDIVSKTSLTKYLNP